jgi:hypothetical protein
VFHRPLRTTTPVDGLVPASDPVWPVIVKKDPIRIDLAAGAPTATAVPANATVVAATARSLTSFMGCRTSPRQGRAIADAGGGSPRQSRTEPRIRAMRWLRVGQEPPTAPAAPAAAGQAPDRQSRPERPRTSYTLSPTERWTMRVGPSTGPSSCLDPRSDRREPARTRRQPCGFPALAIGTEAPTVDSFLSFWRMISSSRRFCSSGLSFDHVGISRIYTALTRRYKGQATPASGRG